MIGKIALLAAATALSGCVVYPVGHGPGRARVDVYDTPRSPPPQHRHWGHRDRDRDGVPNRQDARPDNPRRY